MALLNRLKEYRARLGINQTELGKLAGVSREYEEDGDWCEDPEREAGIMTR